MTLTHTHEVGMREVDIHELNMSEVDTREVGMSEFDIHEVGMNEVDAHTRWASAHQQCQQQHKYNATSSQV